MNDKTTSPKLAVGAEIQMRDGTWTVAVKDEHQVRFDRVSSDQHGRYSEFGPTVPTAWIEELLELRAHAHQQALVEQYFLCMMELLRCRAEDSTTDDTEGEFVERLDAIYRQLSEEGQAHIESLWARSKPKGEPSHD